MKIINFKDKNSVEFVQQWFKNEIKRHNDRKTI